jgi:hypothetical protein
MSMKYRSAFACLISIAVAAGPALAQSTDPSAPPPPAPTPASTLVSPASVPPPSDRGPAPAEQPNQPNQPKRGDFDAGGQVRLPSGPDEMDQFAAFNWIAFDLKGRYYLLDSVTVNATAPLAVKKPDALMSGADPRLIGGVNARLEAMLPGITRLPGVREGTELGLMLSVAYLREGALLLSEKDYPLFTGDFQPGFTVGPIMKVKLSNLLDFSLTPVWLYQKGELESIEAVQVPMSVIVRLGEVAKLSADLGVYLGDDYSIRGRNGGRIATGGSLTVKLGPILAHAGAGVASLLTGGAYPTIRDSVYVDLNVKYVK